MGVLLVYEPLRENVSMVIVHQRPSVSDSDVLHRQGQLVEKKQSGLWTVWHTKGEKKLSIKMEASIHSSGGESLRGTDTHTDSVLSSSISTAAQTTIRTQNRYLTEHTSSDVTNPHPPILPAASVVYWGVSVMVYVRPSRIASNYLPVFLQHRASLRPALLFPKCPPQAIPSLQQLSVSCPMFVVYTAGCRCNPTRQGCVLANMLQ